MPRTKPDKGKGKGKGPKDVLALARARVELRWAIAEAILSTTVDAWDGGCSGGTVDAWVKATRHLLMLHGFRPGAVALDDEQLNILRDVLGDVSGVATFDFRPGALAQGGHSRSRGGGGRSRSHGGRRGRPTSGSGGASNGLPRGESGGGGGSGAARDDSGGRTKSCGSRDDGSGGRGCAIGKGGAHGGQDRSEG